MQPQIQSGPAAAPAVSDSPFDNAVPPALKSLIDRYGVTLLGESARLRGLLQDECPQAKKEISVLLQALDERVPQDLLRVHSGEPIQSLSPRLAKRLSEEKAMSPAASRWAVQAWAQGLGVESVLASEPAIAELDASEAPAASPASAANEPRMATATLALPLNDKRVRAGLAGLALAAAAAAAWWMMTPNLEVTRVETQGPVVGNGRPHPVFVDFQARNASVRNVEVRFVRGDGSWNPASWKHEVSGDAATQGRAPAGTLQYKSARPMSATFEYVLVAADGKRSAPFERTFDIAAPVTITGIKVPRPLRVGREFALAIGYEKGPADIVKIERRIVESNVPWTQSETVQQVKLGGESGSFDYKFDAVSKPMRSTLEFVMVDAQGVRSDPVRVALDVGSPVSAGGGVGTVQSIVEAKQKGAATGLGAVIGGVLGGVLGHQVGGGRGRDVATVAGVAGGAYAGHEVEKNVRGGSSWDTTVRFDDGSTRVIRTTTAPRWRNGERVSFANGVLSPAAP